MLTPKLCDYELLLIYSTGVLAKSLSTRHFKMTEKNYQLDSFTLFIYKLDETHSTGRQKISKVNVFRPGQDVQDRISFYIFTTKALMLILTDHISSQSQGLTDFQIQAINAYKTRNLLVGLGDPIALGAGFASQN